MISTLMFGFAFSNAATASETVVLEVLSQVASFRETFSAVLEAAALEDAVVVVEEELPPQALSAPVAASAPIATRNWRREISFFIDILLLLYVQNVQIYGAQVCSVCCFYFRTRLPFRKRRKRTVSHTILKNRQSGVVLFYNIILFYTKPLHDG